MSTSAYSVSHGSDETLVYQVFQVVIVLLCVLAMLGGMTYIGYLYEPQTDPIQRVMGLRSSDVSLPPDAADWQPVELPRRLCPPSKLPCYDHYTVDLPSDQASLGVFLPGFSGSLRVSVNGVKLAQFGELSPPVEHLLFQPAFVSIPAHVRSAEGDKLVLTIGADRGHFLRMSPFFVGDATALERTWRISSWLGVDLLVASTGIYLVLGFLTLLIFLLTRQHTLFLWFAAIVLCAATRNSFFLWIDPHYDFWRSMIYFQASLGLLAAVVGFVGNLVGTGRDKTYLAIALATVGLVFAFGWRISLDNYEGSHFANSTTLVLTLAAGAWALWLLAKYLLSGWHIVKPWVFALFIGAMLFTLHDVAQSLLYIPIRHQLTTLAPLLIVIALCLILAHQFSNALQQVQTHNAQLSDAVACREQALHTAYGDIRRAERERVVAAERLRILQDVHDGVGGRLAGLVLLARRQGDSEMASQIQESLTDLRLIIDSLDNHFSNDLAAALTLFQSRIEPTLTSQGITSNWHIRCGEHSAVTPSWMMVVFRSLQEALHNVIRHAEATNVSIGAKIENQVLKLTIIDDGQGVADVVQALQSGRGLSHIKHRVESLGGTMRLTSKPSQTRLTLIVPLLLAPPQHPQESGVSN